MSRYKKLRDRFFCYRVDGCDGANPHARVLVGRTIRGPKEKAPAFSTLIGEWVYNLCSQEQTAVVQVMAFGLESSADLEIDRMRESDFQLALVQAEGCDELLGWRCCHPIKADPCCDYPRSTCRSTVR